MFTGIVSNIGEVKSIHDRGIDKSFAITCDYPMDDIDYGASICCSGCCLTVTDKGSNWFMVDVSAESLSKTVLGKWQAGVKVNLERSMQVGDEFGGHFVFGHVDTIAKLVDIRTEGESHRLRIEVPEQYSRYLASKGSVSLDGISLTINEVEGNVFGVNIIPHTWHETTLQYKHIGDYLNFEADMMARYVARQFDSMRAE